MSSIPRTFDDLTPEWLTATLKSCGLLEEDSVVDCHVQQIGEEFGFASRVGRIELTYDSEEREAPSSLIAKLASTDTNPAMAKKLWEKCILEAGFYSNIGTRAGLNIPECYFVACGTAPDEFILLLEDLKAGRFGDAAKGCSLEEAGMVVDGLAGLHAAWWNNPLLENLDWVPTYGNISSQIEILSQRRDGFLEHYGPLSAEVEEVTQRIGRQHTEILERLQGLPQTLLHVDIHLDNVVFMGEGSDTRAVIFDWQGTSKGLCAVDLSSFLSGAFAEPDHSKERNLIQRYHEKLTSAGVEDYSFEQLLADYRIALLRWWIGTVNGYGSDHAKSWTGRQAELGRQAVNRWNKMIRDYDLLDLL